MILSVCELGASPGLSIDLGEGPFRFLLSGTEYLLLIELSQPAGRSVARVDFLFALLLLFQPSQFPPAGVLLGLFGIGIFVTV